MLLPSPTHTTFLPWMLPRCSTKVWMSASSWHGWKSSVRALITGTCECCANVSTVLWAKVRIITASTMRDSTRAESSIGSPRPSWVSRGDRKMLAPPNCVMATSNDTRVRVEDFSKIIPSVLPRMMLWRSPRFCIAFSSMARAISRFSSAGDKSSKVRKWRTFMPPPVLQQRRARHP